VLPGWERLAHVRDELGVRGPIHAAERLMAYFGARRFVIGFTHSPYAGRLLGALEHLGADHAVTVRGVEGSDVLRPGRPTAFDRDGQLELPEDLGLRIESDGGPEVSAAMTRALLAGEHNGGSARAIVLSAAVQLYAAGIARDPLDGIERAAAALRDGRAAATLDALVDA
jgi:anthranilate phosphoribosyltransferase